MRLHLPAIPGQPVRRENSTCAFTENIVGFAQMFDVELYEADCDSPPDYDDRAAWSRYNHQLAEQINERAEPGDLLLCAVGIAQAEIAALTGLRAVEFAVGYGGTFAPHRVFPSYAWMHTVLGADAGSSHLARGSSTDTVIPHYFDPADFPEGAGDGGYLLYIGRLTEDKGVGWACEAAERAGKTLLIAGEGPFEPTYGHRVGRVGPDDRAELMGAAEAVLAPTQYVEPFGRVVGEAMLCGTPVISTDWGAFTELVMDGETGWRCSNVEEMVDAIGRLPHLSRERVRDYALGEFSLDAVKPLYGAYLAAIAHHHSIHEGGLH